MSNRKTARAQAAATRKKKAGFNPRSNARKEIRLSMGQLFAAIDKYEANVKNIGERIEVEREEIHKKAGDKKDLALSALESAYAVFLAVISKNKETITDIMQRADAVGLNGMETSKSTDLKWEDIKFEMVAVQASIGEFHGEVVLLTQEFAVTISTIFIMYENYTVKLRNGDAVDMPDFQSEFTRLVAEAEAVQEDEKEARDNRASEAFELLSAQS